MNAFRQLIQNKNITMKQILRPLLFFAFAGNLILTSCDDNDEITPPDDDDTLYDVELTLTEGGGDRVETVNVDANTQSEITALVTFTSSDASMKRLYITQNAAGQGEEPFEIGADVDKKGDGSIDIEAANSNGIEYVLELPVPSGVDQGTVEYNLWTTTGRGDYRDPSQRFAVGIGTITLSYGGTNEEAEVKTFSQKMFAAPLADGSSETFISLLDGELYRIDQGEEYAAFWDFGYYYGAVGLASFASTDDYPSTIINIETVANSEGPFNHVYFAMSSMNSTDFDNVAVAGDLDDIETPTDETITQLEVGDIIEFEDQYGKKGLIRVTEIEPGDGSDDYIKVDIKVQP